MYNILSAVFALGAMGLVFGLILAFASNVFYVKEDERIPKILENLPGANCGGCGFAGCSALATAIAEGRSPANGCPTASEDAVKAIAEIMGVKAEVNVRKHAQVFCTGTNKLAALKYEYHGVSDCLAAMRLGGGSRTCSYGCIGLGTCAAKCPFGAISIIEGAAAVDEEKCTGCGVCVDRCQADAVTIKDHAQIGDCIGCGLCVSTCPAGAITMVRRDQAEMPPIPKNEYEWLEERARARGMDDGFKRLFAKD
jgi:electron transport complex protein RnfB